MAVETTTQEFEKISFTKYGRFDECKSMLIVDTSGGGSVAVEYKLGESGWIGAESISSTGVYMVDRRVDMRVSVTGTVQYQVD